MPSDEADPARWPEDLRAVFAAIGACMGSGRLRPDLIVANDASWRNLLPGQQVSIAHISGAELGEKTGKYVIEIHGSQWDGPRWDFRSGALEQLARAAAAANRVPG